MLIKFMQIKLEISQIIVCIIMIINVGHDDEYPQKELVKMNKSFGKTVCGQFQTLWPNIYLWTIKMGIGFFLLSRGIMINITTRINAISNDAIYIRMFYIILKSARPNKFG